MTNGCSAKQGKRSSHPVAHNFAVQLARQHSKSGCNLNSTWAANRHPSCLVPWANRRVVGASHRAFLRDHSRCSTAHFEKSLLFRSFFPCPSASVSGGGSSGGGHLSFLKKICPRVRPQLSASKYLIGHLMWHADRLSASTQTKRIKFDNKN